VDEQNPAILESSLLHRLNQQLDRRQRIAKFVRDARRQFANRRQSFRLHCFASRLMQLLDNASNAIVNQVQLSLNRGKIGVRGDFKLADFMLQVAR